MAAGRPVPLPKYNTILYSNVSARLERLVRQFMPSALEPDLSDPEGEEKCQFTHIPDMGIVWGSGLGSRGELGR